MNTHVDQFAYSQLLPDLFGLSVVFVLFSVTNSFSFHELCYHWSFLRCLLNLFQFVTIAKVREIERSNNNFVDTQNNQNEIYDGKFFFWWAQKVENDLMAK